jgi:hypothetical protein
MWQVVLGVPKLASKWKLLQQVVSGVAEHVDEVAHVVDGAVDQVVLLYMVYESCSGTSCSSSPPPYSTYFPSRSSNSSSISTCYSCAT